MGGLASILFRKSGYEIETLKTLCTFPNHGVCGLLEEEATSALSGSCQLCGAGRATCPESLAACRQCDRRVCLDCMGVCRFHRFHKNGPCMLCQLRDKYDGISQLEDPPTLIGQGASGKIYGTTNPDLIVKVFDREGLAATDAACKEMTAMWKIARCHMCEFILSARAIRLDKNAIWIVLPRMDQDLEGLIKGEWAKEKEERSQHLLDVLPQMAEALEFMHGKGLIHCDVKPANILVKKGGGRIVAKLSDFDTCLSMRHIRCVYDQIPEHRVTFELWQGTEQYLPPESKESKTPMPTEARDIFALALVAAQVALCQLDPDANPDVPGWFVKARKPDSTGEDYSPLDLSNYKKLDWGIWKKAIEEAWSEKPEKRSLRGFPLVKRD